MSTETANELVVIEKANALEIFTAKRGLDPYLGKIREEIDAFVPDIRTQKGRAAVASIAYKVAKSKTYLDGIGKELVEKLKEQPKLVDAERKRMRDLLDSWKDEVRKPLTEWETAEQDRKHAHLSAIDSIHAALDELQECTAVDIAQRLAEVEGVKLGEHWEEFEAQAARAKDDAISNLRTALEKRQKYEAEQEELARLRAEQEAQRQREHEERIAREAAERATREAEEAARAHREALERKEREAREAAERAEREKLAAIEAAERKQAEAVEAERKRQADEQARIEAEAIAREADKEHKATVNRAALAAFVAGGMPEECAKQAVKLIAKGEIPGVKIHY